MDDNAPTLNNLADTAFVKVANNLAMLQQVQQEQI